MPTDVTIFGAKYLVFIEAALAAALIVYVLYRQPRNTVVRWVVAGALILVLSYLFAKLGSLLYSDPRPFTQDHVKPLIPHSPDNGFPSDHALLGAALVALVGLLKRWAVIPFALLAILVDWARVGAGIHHVIDVIGSDGFVVLATLIALAATPFLFRFAAESGMLEQGSAEAG
jgi:undecaprenyl-diphosphatase